MLVYVFLFLLGIALLGNGITGFASLNKDFEYCNDNADCLNKMVCCKIYGSDRGLCDLSNNCDFIYETSKNEINNNVLMSPLNRENLDRITAKIRATNVVDGSFIFVLIGTLMLFLGFSLFKKFEN